MSKDNLEHTRRFDVRAKDEDNKARQILLDVYKALTEKGTNPINQLVGYLLSGDPAYITSHNHARSIICQLERDELIEELLRVCLNELGKE